MAIDLLTVFLLIAVVEFIMGNLGNKFIAVVNCIAWTRRRKLYLCDHLLTALAISNICLLWFLFISYLLSIFYPMKTFKKEIVTIMNNVWIVTCHFSIWFATSLSLFYFLKIASFSNSVFLYLKWRVEKVVSVTLLLSLLLLLCNIVQANIEIGIRIKLHKRNMTLDHISMESAHLFTILMSVESLFMVIPFTVSLTAFLLLIFSLWKHLRKMQLNARESRDASTKAHLKGLQTVIASNVLWIIFFLSILVLTWSPELQEKHLIIMVFYVFAMSYPSGHSCILILGNRKLKLASISVLWWLKSWFKKCFLRYIRS